MSRTAKALETLRDQIDAAYPNRSKGWDGTLGDAKHRARKSDHNPNKDGVVQGMDITHDPSHGVDSYKLADKLLASHDPRIKYIISNHRIGSSYKTGGVMPWKWRPYNDGDPHDHHVHVSVVDDEDGYDSTEPWNLGSELVPEPLPKPPVGSDLHQAMMRKIINYEYEQRPFKVYTVTDGTREVAGINEGKLPEAYAKIVSLVGDDKAVEREAIRFYLQYTNIAQTWHSDPGVEFYLRDCILNRGPTGAAKILQKAVGVEVDGAVGPLTKAAIAKKTPAELLEALNVAREEYEIETYGQRPALWKGMQNRWKKALADAKTFMVSDEPPVPVVPTPPVPVVPDQTVDWALVARLYSIDWEKALRLQEEGVRLIQEAQELVRSKMKQPKEMKMMTEPTPQVVTTRVTPWYTSKTVWLAAIAAVAPVINALTKGKIDISPDTQDAIAAFISAMAGGGAIFSKITSANIQPSGAMKALDDSRRL